MFEGDLIEGELEMGQIAGLIKQVLPAKDIINEMITDFEKARREVVLFDF
jgi:enoyl-[acyl-carrier protein] reductase II